MPDDVRQWLAGQIRARIAGPQGGRRAREIFDAPGPRLIPVGSPVRKVHADSSMFIGGLRALLMQSLHPLAMAGVAEHSDYRSDPWGRLQRTADFLAVTTYGPLESARRGIDAVKRVHERVVGTAPDGRPYAANDPHLLKWVHVVEVDSFLVAHLRFGGEPLSRDEVDGYVRDMARIAAEFGIVDPPRTKSQLDEHIAAYRPELRSTQEARDAARYLLVQPPLPVYAYPAYLTVAASAVSLMPRWTRWPLRLPLVPVTERLLVRPAGNALTGALRWAMSHPADSAA